MERQNYFICIDLKSFYASVECVERKLDPFKTNLVVGRSDKIKIDYMSGDHPGNEKTGGEKQMQDS